MITSALIASAFLCSPSATSAYALDLAQVHLEQDANGWAFVHATPGVAWRPRVSVGRAYRVIDSDGLEVGAVVRPGAGGAVVVDDAGFTWITAQLDFDADGGLDGLDAAKWVTQYALGSCLCDFDADGFTDATDLVLWSGAIEAARPGYVVALDVDRDGWVTGEDFDEFLVRFVGGDARADFDGNGFVNGDDYDAFSAAFAGDE